MLLKKMILASLAIALIQPIAAQAEFVLANHTSSNAVASMGYSCSSNAGNLGVAHPHSEIIVQDYILDIACGKKCSANIFIGNNCRVPKIATVMIDNVKKVIEVSRIDNSDYTVVASGNHLVISETSSGLKKWLDHIF